MPHSESRTGRILVVDDQPANLRVVGALLERNGYAVATAGNGPDALAAARAAPPQAALEAATAACWQHGAAADGWPVGQALTALALARRLAPG